MKVRSGIRLEAVSVCMRAIGKTSKLSSIAWKRVDGILF